MRKDEAEPRTRYAIYFLPLAHSSLHRFGSAVLGNDCYSGSDVLPPAEFAAGAKLWRASTREPRRYASMPPSGRRSGLSLACTEAQLVSAFSSFAALGPRRRPDGAHRLESRGAGGMTWFINTQRFARARTDGIGPGRLILVVGAERGRQRQADPRRPRRLRRRSVRHLRRRIVTRAATEWEDEGTSSSADFRHAAAGAYAF